MKINLNHEETLMYFENDADNYDIVSAAGNTDTITLYVDHAEETAGWEWNTPDNIGDMNEDSYKGVVAFLIENEIDIEITEEIREEIAEKFMENIFENVKMAWKHQDSMRNGYCAYNISTGKFLGYGLQDNEWFCEENPNEVEVFKISRDFDMQEKIGEYNDDNPECDDFDEEEVIEFEFIDNITEEAIADYIRWNN